MMTYKKFLSGVATSLAASLLLLTMSVGNGQIARAQTLSGVQTLWSTHYFAPYNFVPGKEADLVWLSQQTGTSFFALAFIINGGGKACHASWNGIQPIGSWMQNSITRLQKAGGDVSVSFGGASGTEIADSCTTVNSLEAQYQSVITTYNSGQFKSQDPFKNRRRAC